MITNNIKKAAKLKKISLKDLAEAIEMSETGFHQALNNNTLRVDILIKIAEVLNVPIGYFFKEEESSSLVNESNFNYTTKHKGNVSQSTGGSIDVECRKLLEEKTKELEELSKKYIKLLESKIN